MTGIGFVWLGVLLFFDRKLIAMGDILFLAGFAFLSGFHRTIRCVAYIFRKQQAAALPRVCAGCAPTDVPCRNEIPLPQVLPPVGALAGQK